MRESGGPRMLDARCRFRILVASRPSVSCLRLGYATTPSYFGGVFCVNRPSSRGVGHV